MKLIDFRLQVFYEVASRLSFTKAAIFLNITQPAVTKHIREIEYQINTRLFERKGNRIYLTSSGNLMLRYAEKIMSLYSGLEADLSRMNNINSGIIRIGASTTVAQTVMPKLLALFKKNHPEIQLSFRQGNTEVITQLVVDEALDIAIVEGAGKFSEISYTQFLRDEIVLVTAASNTLSNLKTIDTEELYKLPLVMREAGSGTLDVVLANLISNAVDIDKLITEIKLESTIAIKEYLLHSNSVAFLSVQSIHNELNSGHLRIVKVKNISIYRDFQFIQLQGNNPKLIEFFKRFCLIHYN
ncbi:LysR substrate-binding domain-containing protein [Sphingobacterium rhinopitheci]|uniref:LysR substrate-binding domain-containing protein n=1 Tax=Sphingobacterium rhinopitheci TaxID=2781960 RepID=UPI001F520985|nr:LysR substrate-binding domain-containing protein [Sphingobacterium rhinopitheci]MCI0922691.1 LysR family transcriptional regulator [Sphingobacterium rhinopitheci]